MNNLGSKDRPLRILVVEDNPGDIRLIVEALNDIHVHNEVHVVTDGEQALSFLNQTGEYVGVPLPHIIFLDINLPKLNGYDILKVIKSDPDLNRILVVM